MLRYFIVCWDENCASARDFAGLVRRRLAALPGGFRTAIDMHGLLAGSAGPLHPADREILFPDKTGVIFGTLFSSQPAGMSEAPSPVEEISMSEAADLRHSAGRIAVTRYWGSYVLALRDPQRAQSVVLRGPVGTLPCFQTLIAGVRILFSDVEDLSQLGLGTLSVNWDCLAAQVANADFLCSETALREIEMIEGGECLRVRGSECSQETYWTPGTFLRERDAFTFEEAVAQLRTTADRCIGAWAGDHKHILHTLSGGLDSSIILCSLKELRAAPEVTAITYFARGCGDERKYARSMAASKGVPLIELERNSQLDLSCFRHCRRTVTPILDFSAPDAEPRNNALAAKLGATAILNGELGDNIFGNGLGPGILIEHMERNGLRPGLLSVALEFAQLTRQSLWRSLRILAAERAHRRETPYFSARLYAERVHGVSFEANCLVSDAALAGTRSSGSRFIHRWLQDVELAFAGKFHLLFGLIHFSATGHHSPFSGPTYVPTVSPLGSQPLIELALRIPTYFHVRMAQDRAVARTAYQSQLTPDVLNRGTAKGGPDLWAKDVINHNLGFLREYLLDGLLVSHGLLSKKKVEDALSTNTIRSATFTGDVFGQLYIESWLRNWIDARVAAAA